MTPSTDKGQVVLHLVLRGEQIYNGFLTFLLLLMCIPKSRTFCLLASILIIIFSFVLFLYWLRYTCLLLLQNRSVNYALKVASTNRLSFPQIQEALQTTTQTTALDRLEESLEHDYKVLTDLLQHATGWSFY